MKLLPLSRLLTVMRAMSVEAAKQGWENVSREKREELSKTFLSLADSFENDIGLPFSADQLRRASSVIVGAGGTNPSDAGRMLQEAIHRIEDECNRHIVLTIDQDHVKYFSNAQLFDPKDTAAEKVSDQFPSAAEDIAESGKCLACGRGTACVMHLARVMESGLAALARAVGVGKQNDWGRYLREIDEALQDRLAKSGARTPDEQFYAEARVTFDGVRRAWRNPTMHLEKTYTVEHAEEILIATRSFMRHLATKLHD